ncbi:MAG: glycosyltransferase family 4 protein [Anaerolineae bacterium]|nr:glycosyltransferase family 4 protein [Anaerolineae bacterium]
MRVALLPVFPQEHWTSIGVYTRRLTQGLRALGVELVEVHPQAWEWPASSWRILGRQFSLRTLGIYLSRWLKYPLLLRNLEADVFHILDNSYGHLAFFLDPRRTVVTSHGGTPLSWRKWSREGPAIWQFDWAFKGMLRAARILCVSEYAKRELLAEAPGYPPHRVLVVYHGIEPIFQPLPQEERAQWRKHLLSSGGSWLLLHVGHNAARKNVEVLYRVVALLRAKGVAVHLLRVGGLPTPEMESLIKELGIGKWVTHVGHVENTELPAYYSAADVFLFPSLYEGFGIPLIEAMACGAPVVCSDMPLFHEVCGEAALFADPLSPEAIAEAVRGVLEKAALREALRRRGLERAKLFNWQETARQTLAVYRQVSQENA